MTPAEQREMTKYQRLYAANQVAHTMGPTNSTLTENYKGHDMRFDPLTKSIVNRPLELVPNKLATVELTNFF